MLIPSGGQRREQSQRPRARVRDVAAGKESKRKKKKQRQRGAKRGATSAKCVQRAGHRTHRRWNPLIRRDPKKAAKTGEANTCRVNLVVDMVKIMVVW
jgi:hypothetical protein